MQNTDHGQTLRASPNFALQCAMDGRAYVAKQVEPYSQYWMTGRERVLFTLFARRGGLSIANAIDAALCLDQPADPARERSLLAKAVAGMCKAGVLLDKDADTSRYDAQMAAAYLRHRPFPRSVARHLIDAASIRRNSRVLDLAGGPGSLALEMAQESDQVEMIELSKGFVAASRRAARSRGVKLKAIHESANRLPFHDGAYDVITVSQALHWLDDVAVCKGVCRLLNDGGSFFVVHGALTLAADHPLGPILGDTTPFGDKTRLPFIAEVEPLFKRIALLFDALDAPDVARHDPSHGHLHQTRIVPVATTLFRQRRPIGEGFARAFLSSDHIAATGMEPGPFWDDLGRRCAVASADQMLGTQEFALLQFKRGGMRCETVDPTVIDIGLDG